MEFSHGCKPLARRRQSTPTTKKSPALAIEEIVSGVGHAQHVAWKLAGIGGGQAAYRIYALDVGDSIEDAWPAAFNGLEPQPLDGARVGSAAPVNGANHIAAAVTFPRGADVVSADNAVAGEQHRLRPQKDPA